MPTKSKFDAKTTAEEIATALSSHIAGKTVLITGVSPGGLGLEASQTIANAGAGLLIITGRSRSKLDVVQKQLLEAVPSVNIRLLELDIASRESIRRAAKEVLAYKESSIDVLINNASPLLSPYTLIDGVESMFATTYLGHFLFTSLIFPKILTAPDSRIVNVGSGAQHAQGIRFGDIQFKNGEEYDSFKAYGQAKTANTLFAVELAQRYASKGLQAYSLHPGEVFTVGAAKTFFEAEPKAQENFVKMGIIDAQGNPISSENFKWKSLEEGVATHVVAAFDPNLKAHNGGYLVDSNIANEQAAAYALDKSIAKQLWDLSEQLLGHKFGA